MNAEVGILVIVVGLAFLVFVIRRMIGRDTDLKP
jgi:hypothetical protein